MYPKSGMGYVIGAMCALTGILATGLPVPIIANNFNLYYSHAKLKDELRLRKVGCEDEDESEMHSICSGDHELEEKSRKELSL